MRTQKASVGAVLAMLLAACASPVSAPEVAGPTPTSSPTAERQGGGDGGDEDSGRSPGFFYPATYREGDRLVMPITFVDGSSAEIVFPPSLGLQDMGALSFQSGGVGHIERGVNARHGDGSEFRHRGPLETYGGHDGAAVEVWEPKPGGLEGAHLVYRFGEWFVGVRTEGLTEPEKRAWARNLVGRETTDGWLVLEAMSPLVLARAGQHDGPVLVLETHGAGPFLEFIPGPCRPPEGEGDAIRTMKDRTVVSFSHIGGETFASWCEDRSMRIQVNAAGNSFAEAAARGLRARKISLAGP